MKRFSINFYHQYQFSNVNWIDFNIINLSFEKDFFCKTYELQISLIGNNWRFIYYYGTQKDIDDLNKSIEESWKSSRTLEEIDND